MDLSKAFLLRMTHIENVTHILIQKGFNGVPAFPAQEIVYCVTSVQKIVESGLPFVFTDGHAVDHLSAQYEEKDVNRLEELLDWQAIRSPQFKSDVDLDLKRRKQAEFLVLGDIPTDCILGFVVYNAEASQYLKHMGLADNQVHINKNYYFAL